MEVRTVASTPRMLWQPRPVPGPGEPPLVGRGAQIDRLVSAVAGARSGRSHPVVLTGAAGCGLSRLLRELGAEVARRRLGLGFRSVSGRAAAGVPYGCLVTLLRDDPGGFEAVVAGIAALGIPDGWVGTVVADRMARRLTESAAAHPLVVVIDDLSEADPGTRALVGALAAALTDTRVCLVVAVHDDREIPPDVDALVRADGVEVVAVPPVPDDELAQLATEVARPSSAADLVRLARGRPGLLVSLARAPDTTRALVDVLAEWDPPAAPGAAAAVVVAAGWSRGAIDGPAVAAAADAPVDLVPALLAAGILDGSLDAPRPGQEHWLHAAQASVPAARSTRTAARIARLLQERGAPPASVAEAWEGAGDARAGDAWLLAAERSRASSDAAGEAAALARAWTHRDADAKRTGALRTARALRSAGRGADCVAVVDEALALLPRTHQAARIDLLVVRHRAAYDLGRVGEADADLDEALEVGAGLPPRRAMADALVLDALRRVADDPAVAAEQASRADALAALTGDDDVRAAAVGAAALATAISGRTDASLAEFDRALALAERAQDPVGGATIACNRAYVLWRAGRPADLLRSVDAEIPRLESLGLLSAVGAQLVVGRATALWFLGRWDELHAWLEQASRLAVPAEARAYLALMSAELRLARGEADRADALLAQVAEGDVGAWASVAVELEVLAAELVAQRSRAGASVPPPTWRPDRTAVEAAADELGRLRLGVAALREHVEAVAPGSAALPPDWGEAPPSFSREAAALWAEGRALAADAGADVADEPGASAPDWRTAVAAWEVVPAPYPAARCRLGLALALLAAGRREDAAQESERVLAAATELGARPLAEAAEGVARSARTRPGVRTAGPLTVRELDVLREVALGRTNREIGRVLGMSERTVAVHLSRAFTKLGAGTRAEAVHLARTHGLMP